MNSSKLDRIIKVTRWLEERTGADVEKMLYEIVLKVIGDDLNHHQLIQKLKRKYGKKR